MNKTRIQIDYASTDNLTAALLEAMNAGLAVTFSPLGDERCVLVTHETPRDAVGGRRAVQAKVLEKELAFQRDPSGLLAATVAAGTHVLKEKSNGA